MSSRRRVLIFMSHQSEELSPFLSVYLPVSSSMTLSLPPHLSLSVSLTLPLFSSPPPGSSTLDMRVWICVCVCQCKYPCFSSQITFIFSSSPSFVKLPVLSLTLLQRVCPHLCHRPSCLLFCSLPRLLSVPSPSLLSLCFINHLDDVVMKCNCVLRWHCCIQICVCITSTYCVSLCV